MIDDQHLALVPDYDTRTELRELAATIPKLGELTQKPAGGPTPDHVVSVFQSGNKDAPTFSALTGISPEPPTDDAQMVYQLVRIPVPGRSGTLYVSRMPGFGGPLNTELAALFGIGIQHIVSLVPEIDIEPVYRNPDYYRLARERLGDNFRVIETVDFEAPKNDELWERTVAELDTVLANGDTAFVHCGAGCGRAGTFTCCLLVHAGMEPLEAIETYRRLRGCGPESDQQIGYIVRYARRIAE